MRVFPLIVMLFAPAAAYSLLRKTPDAPNTPGLACIPVPMAKLVAPGQRATMHVYDASSLQVIRHAQANTDSNYGQVVINETAASERMFKLLEIGSRVKVLSVKPSTHTDKFGGTSSSLMAEVIGVGVIQPDQVLAKMPFMTVECADDDALLRPVEKTAPEDAAAWEMKLAEAAALCESLDCVTSYKGPLSQASEREAGGWSLDDCIACALRERGEEEEASEGGRLQLSALAATAHLPGKRVPAMVQLDCDQYNPPALSRNQLAHLIRDVARAGETRFRAMELAQQGHATQLATLVESSLREEAQRRLAVKALQGLSDGAGG